MRLPGEVLFVTEKGYGMVQVQDGTKVFVSRDTVKKHSLTENESVIVGYEKSAKGHIVTAISRPS